MTFEPDRDRRGDPVLRCVCDSCGASATVRGRHGKTGNSGHGQAVTKLVSKGWSYLGKRLRCPKCEAARKGEGERKMSDVKQKADAKGEAVREPTKKQRLEIISMLMEVYDLESERYTGGDTDDTVAGVLNVMPGWVAEIREAEFGPDGSNDDIEGLAKEIEAFRAEATAQIKINTKQTEQLMDALERVKDFSERLDRIKTAIGPRNQRKAGV